MKSTKRSRKTAITMLPLESHWMPRSTPETADTMNSAVTTTMMMIAMVVVWGTPQMKLSPLFICRAPRPRDVHDPNRVAKIARMSSVLPGHLSTLSPRIGRNAELTRLGAPLRKVKYAMVRATTA